jgi:methylmalonyl-CoA mutase
MMAEKLFSEFEEATKAQWKERVLKELNGAPYEKLIWEKDALQIEPYYTKEEVSSANEQITELSNQRSWQVRQDFPAADFKHTNKKILKALENGVNAIGIRFTDACAVADMETLLEDVFLDMVSIHFVAAENAESVFDAFVAVAVKRNYDLKTLQGSFDTDPLCKNEQPDYDALKKQLEKFSAKLPLFKLITVHAQGDTAVDELVSAMNKSEKYFSGLSALGYDKNQLAKQLQFFVPVGVEYFIEIAKLRALRILWNRFLSEQGVPAVAAFVQAQKSWKHNDETYPYINMLRHTTEAMSTVMGGCDVLSLRTADKTNQFSNDFFERIAVNIQHILKHESHLDAVADPAAGSYYIETITQKLTEAAAQRFQK